MEDFFKYILRSKEPTFATPFPILIENTFYNAQVFFA